MPFSSPSWRSLNPLKGSLNHPKKVTLNHQEGDFMSNFGGVTIINTPIFSWKVVVAQVVGSLASGHHPPTFFYGGKRQKKTSKNVRKSWDVFFASQSRPTKIANDKLKKDHSCCNYILQQTKKLELEKDDQIFRFCREIRKKKNKSCRFFLCQSQKSAWIFF